MPKETEQKNYLLFRLYGPMASWGDIAVGEYRPSFERPSKSAILGLIAAALGIKRPDTISDHNESERDQLENIHRKLAEALGFAVQVDAVGSLLRDYHTIQRPPSRNKVTYLTRFEEMKAGDLNTTLSTRDYRVGAFYKVAVWFKSENLSYELDAIESALKTPYFPLYLGRKSCPIALPLRPQIIVANSVNDAFKKVDFGDKLFEKELDNKFPCDEKISRYSEEGKQGETFELVRRDAVLSRKRWQFAERVEFLSIISKGE